VLGDAISEDFEVVHDVSEAHGELLHLLTVLEPDVGEGR
jgi:hypothetical protein